MLLHLENYKQSTDKSLPWQHYIKVMLHGSAVVKHHRTNTRSKQHAQGYVACERALKITAKPPTYLFKLNSVPIPPHIPKIYVKS